MAQPNGTILHAGDAVQARALISATVRLAGAGAAGTVIFEACEDAAAPSWDPVLATDVLSGAQASTVTFAGVPRNFLVSTPGKALVRVRATSELGATVSVWVHPLDLGAGPSAAGGGAVSVTSDVAAAGAAWGQVVGTGSSQGNANVATRAILVKADDDNTGSVYVGFASTVTADKGTATSGTRLKATQSLTVSVANTNLLWFRADAAGQNISLMAV